MTFGEVIMKSLLVPFQEKGAARAALAAAIGLAKRFAGHVEGLLVRGEPRLAFEAFVPGMPIPAGYLTEAVEEWRRFADEARGTFFEVTGAAGLARIELGADDVGAGPSAGWSEVEGRESDVIGERARVFDLVVVGREGTGSEGRWRETCEAALFESGRPVLVVPTETTPALGRTVAVAWNGSVESARTVALGLPLLVGAERVVVLSVRGNTVSGPTGADVVGYLRRHGAVVEGWTVPADGRPAGEAILDEAGDIGADLLLKGAFTRSRFRQIVFGGTTQHILEWARLPVMLAH